MVLVTVQLHAVHDFFHLPVYPYIEIPFLPHLLEQLLVMSFAGTHQGSENENALAFIITPDKVENLLFGVFHHFLTRKIRIRDAGTSEQQTQVIIDFGRGPYRRTRVLVRGLLLNGNHRTQPRNLIHIGTLHSSQEIAGVCRESLDIPALALGKDGIESQRRLSASAQASDNRQAIARDIDIYIFQIVHPCSLHTDCFLFFFHALSMIYPCKDREYSVFRQYLTRFSMHQNVHTPGIFAPHTGHTPEKPSDKTVYPSRLTSRFPQSGQCVSSASASEVLPI